MPRWARWLGVLLGAFLRPVPLRERDIPPRNPAREATMAKRDPTSAVPQVPTAARRKLLLREALNLVGVTEQGGDNRGALVERFQRAVDGRAAGEPWCAAFVWFCIGEVDWIASVMGDPARSPLKPSEHVLTIWRNAPESMRRQLPEPGDLMLWQHRPDGKPSERGHIAIVREYRAGGVVATIEGNTGAGPGVEREGDGVFEKLRRVEGEGAMRTLGFLQVWR